VVVYTQGSEGGDGKTKKKGENERKTIYTRTSLVVGRTLSLHNSSSNSSHKYTQDPRTFARSLSAKGFCAVCLGQKR